MSQVVSYRYKTFWVPLFWVGMFGTLACVMGSVISKRQGWLNGVEFLVCALAIVFGIFFLLVTGVADIVLDDLGVQRKAFGVVWQRATWDEVKELRIFDMRSPEDGTRVRSFLLLSPHGAGGFFSRRIAFQERKVGMSDLLTMLESQVKKYGIPVDDRHTT